MRNRNKIYVLTDNLSFFYKINKELNRFNIPFEVLNTNKKLPVKPSIILTTTEDIDKLEKNHDNVNFFIYANNQNFEEYLLKVISAYRVGYKKFYSEITFAIDPGKKCGLMVFLDDYHLHSHRCFETNDLITKIKLYTYYFQNKNPRLINLIFKFGRGILSIAQELVEEIYMIYRGRKNMKIFLIDEFKSSKIKINHKIMDKKISKDETSALILALRDGIETNPDNYHTIFNQIKSRKLKKEENIIKNFDDPNDKKIILDKIAEIAEDVLNGKLSLTESYQMIKNIKNIKYEMLKEQSFKE